MRYNGVPIEDMYFNWYAIDYARQFEAEADQLSFAHDEPGTWKYQAAGFDSGAVTVLDLTYPLTPTRVLNPAVVSGGGGYTATFVATPGQGARYFMAGSGAELSPKSITPHTPLDLSTTAADYVFITPQVFYTTTQSLADYRAAQGLSTLVVTVEELYDQFNFGIYHPIAIKNFLAYTFASWSTPPTYALLVGGGHWNLKGYEGYDAPPIYMPPNLAFVDPWQGEVDSANLLAAVVGDDILADVLIGRLPVDLRGRARSHDRQDPGLRWCTGGSLAGKCPLCRGRHPRLGRRFCRPGRRPHQRLPGPLALFPGGSDLPQRL